MERKKSGSFLGCHCTLGSEARALFSSFFRRWVLWCARKVGSAEGRRKRKAFTSLRKTRKEGRRKKPSHHYVRQGREVSFPFLPFSLFPFFHLPTNKRPEQAMEGKGKSKKLASTSTSCYKTNASCSSFSRNSSRCQKEGLFSFFRPICYFLLTSFVTRVREQDMNWQWQIELPLYVGR